MVLKKNTKRGFSFVEMMVAIAIFSFGMLAFTYLFTRIWKMNSFILEEGQASSVASRTLHGIVEELRKVQQSDTGEYAIKSASDFDLVVYLDDDSDGVIERVHYFLPSGSTDLQKGVTKPSSGSYPEDDTTVEIIAKNIMNRTGSPQKPLFNYYNTNYPGDTVNNPLVFPPASIGDIRLIRTFLWVNIKPLSAPENINMESFVQLRNINDTL